MAEEGLPSVPDPDDRRLRAAGGHPWDDLPDRFVVKCTHGSSSNLIVRDKDKLDRAEAMLKLNGWMRRNWFWLSREWPYKDVKPRILIEEFIGGADGKVPYDYKFLCFDGEPPTSSWTRTDNGPPGISTARLGQHRRCTNRHPNIPRAVAAPVPGRDAAGGPKQSAGIPTSVVDLYEVDCRRLLRRDHLHPRLRHGGCSPANSKSTWVT